ILEEAVGRVRAESQKRDVTLEIEVDPELPTVTIDGPRMTQAVENLVRNGVRFTHDGGRVDVIARREADELLIEVRDNGVGIAEDKQAGLFTRSVIVRDSLHHHSSNTLEFNSAGLGLGLPITRGIVEAHGGTIGVVSKPDSGSTFTMR